MVDTSLTGDLESCKLLKPFKESGDYATFGELGWYFIDVDCYYLVMYSLSVADNLNYSVCVYEGGNILSIVTTGGTLVCSQYSHSELLLSYNDDIYLGSY